MAQYGKPTPNAVCQNNLTFIAPYNPKDPPEFLFKRCADCQEIAIIAKVPYTAEQMLMNVVDLFTQARIYGCDIDNWDQKPDYDKTYLLFCPFIQDTYQRSLTSGTITTRQGGYASYNRFTGLTTDDDVSDNNTTETIAGTISSHIANLSASISAQTTVLNNANTSLINASLQQFAINEHIRNQQHQQMMQQFAMLSTNATAHNFFPQAAQVFNQQHQNYGGRCNEGCTGGDSQGGRGRPSCTPAAGGTIVPYVPPTLPGTIPFINPVIPPVLQQQNPQFSNITKYWANQKVCFSCGFNVKDWHNSNLPQEETRPSRRFYLRQLHGI